jgi:hypothetical protein
MMCKEKVILLLVSMLVLAGCGKNDKKEVDVSGITVSMPVERLEGELFDCGTEADVLDFLNKYPSLATLYFPDLSIERPLLAAKLYQNISNPALRSFKSQLDSIFAGFDKSVAIPLENAFRHLKYYYPDAQVPKIQTMVTGFLGSDLFISDSLIIIGLDYFGGPGARFRPDVHNYQLPRYQKEYIASSIMFFEAQKYNRLNPEDRSLLADMVWYGKNFGFVRHMMPAAPDSLILGFSQEELAKANVSQTDIWAHLAGNKLLYEHIEQKKQKYVGERPTTFEIGEDVPGGIGRWVGWRIVSRLFSENPGLTLQQVMANDNARAILTESGYKGQRDDR